MIVEKSTFQQHTYLFVEPFYIGRLTNEGKEEGTYYLYDYLQGTFVAVEDSDLRSRFEVDATKIGSQEELNKLMKKSIEMRNQDFR